MERIVVGVDPSPAGTRALAWALQEAVERRAALLAVRAWTHPALVAYPDGLVPVELTEDTADAAEEVASAQLKAALTEVAGADTVETRTLTAPGPTAQALLEAAEGTHLLVVGSRGAGALSRALLGSVSAAVLHHAALPVAVVPEGARLSGDDGRVLVGVDHSEHSLAALRHAVVRARRRAAVLVPVLVRDPLLVEGLAGRPDETARHVQALRTAVEGAGGADLQMEPQVVVGQPAATLTRLARPQDVLFTGSRGRGGFASLLLGSTSTQVSTHAVCPVVVVRS